MPEKSVIAEKRVYNMTPEVKERIDQIRHGIVPEGYKKTKVGIVPVEWTEYAIADCLKRVERPVEVKSDEMYTQIGIRSHGKGLFYKEPVNGKSLGNKSVFWIEPDCFVLNIVFAWEQAIGKTTQKEVGMIGSHRFPMYQPINERVDIDYLISYLMTKRGKDILEAASPGGAGRNRTLGQDRFMNSKIVLPTLTEQKKIASILTMQDKLIELEQQKIEEIKKAKRFYFEKMFPKKGQAVPEIRFKGFTAPWEQRKLNEVVNVYDGVHRTPDYKDSGVMFLSVENISTLKSEKYISEEAFQRDYEVYPQKGDILMTRIGDVGTPNVVETTEKVAFYVSLALLKPTKINSYFLCNSIQSPLFQKGMKDRTLVTAIPQKINKDEIGKVNIILPTSSQEQQLIGEYFRNLDNLITLHQRMLEEEKRKKKVLMQLLLTGLVRVNA